MTADVIPHPALTARLHLQERIGEKRREVAWLEEWAFALRDRVKHWSESPWFDAGTQDIAVDNAFDALAFARRELAGLEAQVPV